MMQAAPLRGTSNRGRRLELANVSHRYGAAQALDDVSLSVEPGRIVTLLGPSGCGKTTVLRIVAGLVRQTSGSVTIDGRKVDDVPLGQRGTGIVFQNYALFPHMTVEENVAYGVTAKGHSRSEVEAKVGEVLGLVRMEEFRNKYPRQLSGGQQQRVAIARSLAVEPDILLLDEPFSALDKALRLDMQIEVKSLQRSLGITTVLVTHDQNEALSLSDRIAVLNEGRLQQFGTPDEVYNHCANLFVNTFVGSANVLEGRVVHVHGTTVSIQIDDGPRITANMHAQAMPVGARAVICSRPEHLQLLTSTESLAIDAMIDEVLPLDGMVMVQCRTKTGHGVRVSLLGTEAATMWHRGSSVHIGTKPGISWNAFGKRP